MIGKMLENVRKNCPLIHNITNYVTVNDCANIVIACGASPIMADDKDEVEDITTICGGLNINIGTLNSRTIVFMLIAVKRANALNHPVMVATSGSALMKDNAVQTLIDELLPLSTLVTPNIPEAEVLSGLTIECKEDMITSAKRIGDNYNCAVLLKGGHIVINANDLLYANGEYVWFEGKRIDNPNTHGTGCTLSSAIASNLAKGFH